MKRLLLAGLAGVLILLLRKRPATPALPPVPALAARHPYLSLLALGGAAAALGAIVLVSGVVPIRASSGHWAITEWILQFAKARSVATHSLTIRTPALDDQALVMRGAAHFDLGCRPCHGATAGTSPRIPQAMTPAPPDLATSVPRWRPRELFYIVKHGIKFTGMPAWPAQGRDDEVWAVVAFLQRLPSLDAAAYDALARGEERGLAGLVPAADGAPPGPVPDVVLEVCARCHGITGYGRGTGAFPKLAGQRVDYMDRALRAYAGGSRASGIMAPVAAALSDETRREAAAYYAQQPAAPSPGSGPAESVSAGEAIAHAGSPDRKIPSCAECHGPRTGPKNAAYPRLAGQHASYLSLQLQLFQEGRRGGSSYVHLMHSFVDRLNAAQIRDVSNYYASVPSGIEE